MSFASNFDFDRLIPREHTASVKWDGRKSVFGTEDVLPMWVADMDFAAPAEVTEALKARAEHPIYGYSLYPDALFDAMAGWLKSRHNCPIEPESVLWAPGVVPSLYAAVQAFSQPGEAVIVQPPVYPPFFSAVTDCGRVLVENPLRMGANHYEIDFDHLEQCAAQGARLLLLCSPHNPVGRVWTRAELETVLDIAGRHGMVVLSDEIHHDLIYPGHRHIPLATLPGAEACVVSAVAPSKSFNIPGLGLSALIAPNPQHRAALNGVFSQWHVSASNPCSTTAFTAAYQHGAAWLDALMAYLADTRDAVRDACQHNLPGITALPSEGTYLIWLDCREFARQRGLDDAALRAFFVQKARVGMNPGDTFGTGGSGFMRLNIGTPRATVMDALARIAQQMT